MTKNINYKNLKLLRANTSTNQNAAILFNVEQNMLSIQLDPSLPEMHLLTKFDRIPLTDTQVIALKSINQLECSHLYKSAHHRT